MPASNFALVTGASAGIGAAFARELAARGHSLVLTARRADRLQWLASQLREQYDVAIECIACDLADPTTPQFLHDEIARRQLPIGILINNAGCGVTGSFMSRPWQTHAQFIQLMLVAPTELCHLFLPGMRARGRGRIINVASLAGLVPAPAGHTLYAASKAYLIKFSQALALENRAHGVKVCALCPGFTRSEFHDANGTREHMQRMPRWMWMAAEPVVRDALAALERDDVVRVSGRLNRWIKRAFELLPDRWALQLINRRGRKFRVSDTNATRKPPA
ncbi:MAG: SDR family oxidoreductase [Dokdonella sp.]